MRPARLLLGSALVFAFFGAGWWAGHALHHPTPATLAVAPELPPAAGPAAPSLTLAEAVSQFAGGDRAMPRAALRARLAAATPAEIPGLLTLVAKLPHRLDRERFRAQLLARWVTADPTAARTWAEALPVRSERHVAVRDMIASLGKAAPGQAAAWLLTANLDEPAQQGLVRGIMSGWQALAPAEAEAWIAQIPDPDLRRSAREAFISALAEQDPSVAFEKALATSSERGGGSALGTAARAMVLRDPTSAAAVLARIPSGETRNWAATQVVDALSASDPKLAAEFALTLPAGTARNAAVYNVIRAMAADPDAVFTWIETAVPAGSDRNLAFQNAMRTLTDESPTEAARHLDRLPTDARVEAIKSLVFWWTEKDVATATTWAKQLPPGAERATAIEQLLRARYMSDPAGTVESLRLDFSDLPPDRVAEILSNTIVMSAGSWPMTTALPTDQLLSLLPALPSDEARKRFLESSLRQMSASSPAAAAEFLAALPAEHRSESAIRDVVDAWAGDAPADAAAWAMSLPDTTARRTACDALLDTWSRSDPDAAVRWVCSSQDEQLRTDALYRVAGNWGANDPTAAAEWVAHIDDARFRQSATELIARNWLTEDAEAATKWLATTDLPAERKAALLQEVRK